MILNRKNVLALFIGVITTLTMLAQGYEEQGHERTSTDFNWPEGKKMAISLTFDDARLSQIDKGIPVLESHGVKATFYISPDLLMQRLDGWKKAALHGHDIGNHTLVHPCTGNFSWSREKALEDYTLLQMSNELDSASRFIEEVFGVYPVSFGYPCGQTYVGRGQQTRSYVPLVSAMFASGRTWLDEGPNDPEQCDLAQLTGMELDGKTFDQILSLIETARESGSWLILAGHEMDDGGVQTSLLSTIDSICSYASDPKNEIWIDHVANVGRYVREQRSVPLHTEMLPYQNPVIPVDRRIDDLISRMTLAEKIWQQPALAGAYNFGPPTNETATVRDVVEMAHNSFGRGEVRYGNGSDGPHEADRVLLGFLADLLHERGLGFFS